MDGVPGAFRGQHADLCAAARCNGVGADCCAVGKRNTVAEQLFQADRQFFRGNGQRVTDACGKIVVGGKVFAGCYVACFIQDDCIRESPSRINPYLVLHQYSPCILERL